MQHGITRLKVPSGRRAGLTGHGSRLLARASAGAPDCHAIPGHGLRALYERLRRGLAWQILYAILLPSVEVALSSEATGDVLRQQLTYRRDGRVAFRYAQGVLFLPDRYSDYLRGRHRQALRTNIHRARDQGYVCERARHEEWTLHPDDPRSGHVSAMAPLEVFHISDPDGTRVAEALLTIDKQVALLHMATSKVSYARWLLHAEIVESLCGRCDLLITNTEDVPLMPAGTQHYQRLLGYSVARLRLDSTWAELRAVPAVRMLALCLLGAAAIVTSSLLSAPITGFGLASLSWAITLVAIRRASLRAGPAAGTAALAAMTLLCVRGLGSPAASLGLVLAGVTLDVLLARIPRLTWGSLSVAPAGTVITLLTLGVSELDRLGQHGAHTWGGGLMWLAAALCGGVGAAAGWRLGGLLGRIVYRPPAGAVPSTGSPSIASASMASPSSASASARLNPDGGLGLTKSPSSAAA